MEHQRNSQNSRLKSYFLLKERCFESFVLFKRLKLICFTLIVKGKISKNYKFSVFPCVISNGVGTPDSYIVTCTKIYVGWKNIQMARIFHFEFDKRDLYTVISQNIEQSRHTVSILFIVF